MSVRLSPALLAITALTVASLAGCDTPAAPVATPEPPAVAATPDPAAPAPGTQAAEAIGADSASDAAVIPPEKKQP